MNFMMIGIEVRSDPPGERSFIELLVIERCAKRAESGCGQKLSHCARNSGGIDAPRKEGADRDIAAQPNSHGLSKALANPFDCLLHGWNAGSFIAICGKLWGPEPAANQVSAGSQID